MRRALGLAALALLLGQGNVRAQVACDPGPLPVEGWSAPLDRAITLHDGTVPIADALRLITRAARIRLSYSPELLPLDRSICLEYEGAPVGAVLGSMLSGTSLSAVVAGGEHVVLAATRNSATPTLSALPEVVVLDGIQVAARPAGAEHPAGVVVASISGRELEEQDASSLAEALDGLVPGVWVWPRGSNSIITPYASVRGASSFGLSSPKLFIDGLEVANPLLVSTLDPATIERIDVLRGPQGAAMFGADALAGVTNIITRQGALDTQGSRAMLRTGLGLAGTAFNPSSALEQDHGLSVFTGGPARSGRLDMSFSSLGDYVPEAASSRFSAVGSARSVSDRVSLTATARVISERSNVNQSPLLASPAIPWLAAESRTLSVGQYTAGVTAAFHPGDNWTHTLVAGINGYTLAGAPTLEEARTAVDSALAAAGSAAFRTTLRLTSATNVLLGPTATGAVQFAAEHSALRQNGGVAVAPWWGEQYPLAPRGNQLMQSAVMAEAPGPTPGARPEERDDLHGLARERSSSALSGSFAVTLHERLNFSTGFRLEHTTLESGASAGAMLPSIGGSWTAFRSGPLALALRAAYGKGVRWPQAPSASGWTRQLQLLPEMQSGIETGADLALGHSFSLQATRYNQVATGLTQQVAVSRDSTALHAAGTVLLAQNVGAISNRGWELAAVARHASLTLSGTLSLVDSRVRSLASDYGGDLTAGDRMLAVPARVASISALWTRPTWSAGLSVSRAADWVNYDRIALARAQAAGTSLSTADLRDYWLHYAGSTHLRASFNHDLGTRFALRLSGDNLLDVQTGDPDNATVVPGRTLSLSVKAKL